MSIEIWIAFILAAMLVLIIPGPTIILVMSQAVTHGRLAVLPLVVGVTLGDLTAMTLSLLGLGAVLATSAALFSVLKWIGALYLLYLGISLWRLQPGAEKKDLVKNKTSKKALFKSAYIVTALNPKGIAFFVAFMPQFISSQGDAGFQFLVLGATFLFLAAANAMAYALFAGRLRDAMQNNRVRRFFNRLGGSALVGAGVITATLQRSP